MYDRTGIEFHVDFDAVGGLIILSRNQDFAGQDGTYRAVFDLSVSGFPKSRYSGLVHADEYVAALRAPNAERFQLRLHPVDRPFADLDDERSARLCWQFEAGRTVEPFLEPSVNQPVQIGLAVIDAAGTEDVPETAAILLPYDDQVSAEGRICDIADTLAEEARKRYQSHLGSSGEAKVAAWVSMQPRETGHSTGPTVDARSLGRDNVTVRLGLEDVDTSYWTGERVSLRDFEVLRYPVMKLTFSRSMDATDLDYHLPRLVVARLPRTRKGYADYPTAINLLAMPDARSPGRVSPDQLQWGKDYDPVSRTITLHFYGAGIGDVLVLKPHSELELTLDDGTSKGCSARICVLFRKSVGDTVTIDSGGTFAVLDGEAESVAHLPAISDAFSEAFGGSGPSLPAREMFSGSAVVSRTGAPRDDLPEASAFSMLAYLHFLDLARLRQAERALGRAELNPRKLADFLAAPELCRTFGFGRHANVGLVRQVPPGPDETLASRFVVAGFESTDIPSSTIIGLPAAQQACVVELALAGHPVPDLLAHFVPDIDVLDHQRIDKLQTLVTLDDWRRAIKLGAVPLVQDGEKGSMKGALSCLGAAESILDRAQEDFDILSSAPMLGTAGHRDWRAAVDAFTDTDGLDAKTLSDEIVLLCDELPPDASGELLKSFAAKIQLPAFNKAFLERLHLHKTWGPHVAPVYAWVEKVIAGRSLAWEPAAKPNGDAEQVLKALSKYKGALTDLSDGAGTSELVVPPVWHGHADNDNKNAVRNFDTALRAARHRILESPVGKEPRVEQMLDDVEAIQSWVCLRKTWQKVMIRFQQARHDGRLPSVVINQVIAGCSGPPSRWGDLAALVEAETMEEA